MMIFGRTASRDRIRPGRCSRPNKNIRKKPARLNPRGQTHRLLPMHRSRLIPAVRFLHTREGL